jgi:DNA-directed RNA polymerase specialized sigma subunit
MPENQSLLEQLEQMLHWKKSKKYYAEKLGITEAEVDELLADIRKREVTEMDAEIGNYISELEDQVVKWLEDVNKGTGEVVFNSKDEIRVLMSLLRSVR